jgi:hypothetical protein
MRYLFLLMVMLTACKKSEDRACWKFAGEQVVKSTDLLPFENLYVGTGFDIEFVQDTVNRLQIVSAENLLKFISYEIVEGTLQLKNTNKCRFLRNEKGNKVKMVVYFKEIANIIYEGTGEMKTQGLISTDRLSIMLKEGASPMNLNLEVNSLFVQCEPNYRRLIIKGKTKTVQFNLKGNCVVKSTLNVAEKTTMVTTSTSTSYITAPEGGILKVDLRGRGNVYYKGDPAAIELNDQGEGDLLKEN